MAADRLPADGVPFAFEASPDERAALARRFGLVALDRLEAEGELAPGREPHLVEVRGRLRAAVIQSCVVTLEPVPAEVDATFERLFTRDPAAGAAGAEVEVDPEAATPEPLEGATLDMGELVAEELAVSLDPYPRAPSADAVMAELTERQAEEARPLAGLASLRRVH